MLHCVSCYAEFLCLYAVLLRKEIEFFCKFPYPLQVEIPTQPIHTESYAWLFLTTTREYNNE
jgi:hypothetical protein